MDHLLFRKFAHKTACGFCLFVILALPVIALAEESENPKPFYKNVSANIEMRLVVEPDDENTLWLYMQDLEGTPYKVSKKIFIDSSDIEGGTIYKDKIVNFDSSNANGETFEEDSWIEGIVLYFFPTSWIKVREFTTRFVASRIALIKDGQIISAPMVHEPITKAAVLSVDSKKDLLPWLLQGFSIGPRPIHLDSQVPYIEFLEEWIETHPEDMAEKRHLASLYMQSEESPQYESALPLLKELANAQPKDRSIHSSLLNCYIELGNFDESLKTAQQALSFIQPSDRTGMYVTISKIYFLKDDKDLALKSLEHALENVDEMDFPDVDDLLKKSKKLGLPFTNKLIRPGEIEKLKKEFGSEAPLKNKTIKDIQNLMEYVRTH